MGHLGVFFLLLISLLYDTQGEYIISERIASGIPGELSEFPFLATVQKRTGLSARGFGAWQRFGSGAIVSRYNVLTACHVIADLGVDSFNDEIILTSKPRHRFIRGTKRVDVLNWKHFRVYVGSGNTVFDQAPTCQYRLARELIPHPHCEADGWQLVKNDVGVIRLQRPFDYNIRVHPISIVSLDPDEALTSARTLQTQQVWCKAFGWGQTDDETQKSHNIFWLANSMQLISNDNCWDKFNTNHYACALSSNQSMCAGDSGGPLICQGHLYALHSSSRCTPGYYSYMANIEPITYMINHHVDLDLPLGK